MLRFFFRTLPLLANSLWSRVGVIQFRQNCLHSMKFARSFSNYPTSIYFQVANILLCLPTVYMKHLEEHLDASVFKLALPRYSPESYRDTFNSWSTWTLFGNTKNTSFAWTRIIKDTLLWAIMNFPIIPTLFLNLWIPNKWHEIEFAQKGTKFIQEQKSSY